MASLEHIISDMTPLLQQYGYLVMALAIAVEGIGIPAPGQSLLIVAALLAASGKMSLPLVLLVAAASAFCGNTAGYVLGQKFGHVLLKKGWIKPATEQRLHGFIEKYGIKALLISRFVEGIKQFICIGCGIAQMPAAKFFTGNFMATLIWVAIFGLGPVFLKGELAPLMNFYHHNQIASWAVIAAVVVSLACTLYISWRRKKPEKH